VVDGEASPEEESKEGEFNNAFGELHEYFLSVY
jgi:hypothetical protein